MRIFSLIVRSVGLLHVGLIAVPACTQATGQRLSGLPMAERRIALPDSVSPRTRRTEPLGHLRGDTKLTHLTLTVKRTEAQEAALDDLLAGQQNPASPSYHRWLTPEQFGARFGASDADLQILQQWLELHGFTVEAVAPGRTSVEFSGTAAAAEEAFGVSLQRYRRDGREYFENASPVQLPASFAGVVSGVSGLSSYRLASPRLKAARAGVTPSPQYTTSTGTHYLLPWDFGQVYGMHALTGAGYNGHGITIGVLGQSAVDTAQLTYFQQKTGQAVKLPTMVLVPYTSASAKVTSDEAESELDLEYAGANAPGATIQFIYTGCANASTGDCNNNGVFDALSYAVRNNLAQILSVSYGGCEADDASYAQSTIEPLLKQANAQGQTIVVASGDSGAANCEQSVTATRASAGLAVSYPASSAYVTAIGGTQLTSDSSANWSANNNGSSGSAAGYMPETGWNDTATYGSLTASGGGASKIFTKPWWQTGSGVPQDGQRDVPDIAFAANVSEHAYLICDADEPCVSGSAGFVVGRDGGAVGGTSAATPNFAAMLALVEQANGGGALGNVNPGLYGLAAGANASSIFHDITTGNNIVPCVSGSVDCTNGLLGYSAGAGYDLVTGLGSVSAAGLQPALASYGAATATVSLTASPSTVMVGAPVSFTATVAGGGVTPNGTVTFSIDSAAGGQTVALVSGAATYDFSGFTTSGAHTISVVYSGDSTYKVGTASLTVHASVNSATVAVAVAPVHPVAGSSLVFTASVSGNAGTPAGSVSFFIDNASAAVGTAALTSGTATFSSAGFSMAGVHTVSATYSGDTRYGSASASVPVTVSSAVQTAAPTLKVSVNPAATSVGSPVTIAAAVSGGGAVPTGTVSYTVDGSLTWTGTLAAGAASYTYTGFSTAGIHTVQVSYSGDSSYSGAETSVSVSVTVPGVNLALSTSALTVNAGSSATVTATVSSQNGFSGTSGLTLSMISSTGTTFSGCYSLSPSSVSTAGGARASSTVTVLTSTTGCTGSGVQSFVRPGRQARSSQGVGNSPVLPAGGFAFLSAGVLTCVGLRRRLGVRLGLLAIGLVLMSGVQGCGSGVSSSTSATVVTPSGSTPVPTSPSIPVTKGTYVIQVTATAVGAAGVSATSQFTLTVQ